MTPADRPRGLARALVHGAVVFALTMPLWAWSAHHALLAPGLPTAAVAVVCPALAAVIVSWAMDGPAGVAAWWAHARPTPVSGSARLLWLAAVLPVGVTLLSVLWSLTEHGPDRACAHAGLPLPALLTFVPIALLGAWLEEAGWSAWSVGALLRRGSLLPAALITGTIWALWHLPSLIQVGHPARWILWWTIGTLAMRVTLVWLYREDGHHVVAPLLFHAMDNVCWQGQITAGFEFDPRMHALLMAGIAAVLGRRRQAGAEG